MRTFILLLALMLLGPAVSAEDRTQRFDEDPKWDGHNNRSADFEPRTVTQRFGYSPTQHAGGKAPGELGGVITGAAEPAYYAKKIKPATFDDKLTASGTLAYTNGKVQLLVGFFHTDTLNEWRTPNTIAMRIDGRENRIVVFVEYCTSRSRAGGDSPGGFPTRVNEKTKRKELVGFEGIGKPHAWSITYDPKANGGNGSILVTIDAARAVCNLTPEHRRDGAKFNRFGLLPVMKHAATGGEFWLDDVRVNGELEDFSTDPKWDARDNDRTYVSTDRRPRFDFGFSPTNFAGGQKTGELGGLIFRGDIRYPTHLAYYADRLADLTLDRPLRASGTLALRRGTTDSGVLLGFFHSAASTRTNPSQENGVPMSFMGLDVTGPSREGFFASPLYRTVKGGSRSGRGPDLARVYPDGAVHRWTLQYAPATKGGHLTLKVNDVSAGLDVPEQDRAAGTIFDRFGIITTWIDGNGQRIYFDDLTYTCKQD